MGLGRLLERQDNPAISFTDWAKMFTPGAQLSFNGNRYQAFQLGGTGSPAAPYYDTNSVVFACAAVRMLLFSEARFQYQRMRDGRPGDLFGMGDLTLLERPWENGTTRDLLKQLELDATQYGNSYWVEHERQLVRLDPGKVSILTVGVSDDVVTGQTVGERLAGYAYSAKQGEAPVIYPAEYVGHYAPIPDRTNRFRGMSWLNPCLPDIDADTKMTEHKRTTLNSGAQLGIVVTTDPHLSDDEFDAVVETFRRDHEGAANAGKTLFVSGGTDVKTISQTFEQLSVKATQGAGETRIAACAGVPPVIVGLSEGLSSATYSNYSQARRRLVDGTMRPLWGAAAGALANLIDPPSGARLWYDDRDIPFLREDVKDQAEILGRDAATVQALINSGYDPDAVIDAVQAGDLARLKGHHSGLYSVQLQPPGTEQPTPSASSSPSPPDGAQQ